MSIFTLPFGCAAPGETTECDTTCTVAPEQPESTRPTEEFRTHHAEIIEHLGHIDAMAGSLQGQPAPDQRKTMEKVVTFFKEHIAAHASDEERVLYPVVMQKSGEGSRLTEVPIHEHRIVERSIAGLDEEATKSDPDAAAFARDAMHLVGLLRAHFEVEEQVLLPVLDKTMTREQFKKEVADKMSH